jgi:hypothetical protein
VHATGSPRRRRLPRSTKLPRKAPAPRGVPNEMTNRETGCSAHSLRI